MVLLLTFLSIGVVQAGDKNDKGHEHRRGRARLRNEVTGQEIELHVNGKTTTEVSATTDTYFVAIPPSALDGPSPFTSQNSLDSLSRSLLVPSSFAADTHYDCDSTASACATLTLTYTTGTTGGVTWMYVTKSTAKWDRIDSAVSWSSARIDAACWADWLANSPDGTVRCDKNASKSIGVAGNGTTYQFTTIPWKGSTYKTKVDDLNIQSTKQYILLKRGSTQWAFTFCVAVGGGGLSSGCF